MSTTTINLTIPKSLLAEVDRFAADEQTSRSDIFRISVLEKLRKNRSKVRRDQQELVREMLAEAQRLEAMDISDQQILDSVMSLRRAARLLPTIKEPKL
jgi:metal-responsive CopG/Arc/MetJ family transcriptional regulator